MKIPETSANVGAYYGNEENGQWQPNGVMVDGGVGGGVVGSGDAGLQRPLYPVHVPREHIPGYVMAGPFYPGAAYPAPAVPDDFADYMWMENEEEFDKQVMQQLEEEALMEQCIEAMLEDEQRERRNGNQHRQPHHHHHHHHHPTSSNGAPSLSLEETVSRSRLNPLAAEFVPTTSAAATHTPPTTHTDEKPSVPEASEEPSTVTESPEHLEPTHTTPQIDPTPPPSDPPEVSAADVQTDDKRRDKHKKLDTKKPVKDTKVKAKPVVKCDAKGKRESDAGRGEGGEGGETKPQPAPVEEPTGPKPINYAAAAKANKPKKPVTPPASDKTSPPPALPRTEKKKTEKAAVKTEKPIQRKNSAK